jgi:hypothetical protein
MNTVEKIRKALGLPQTKLYAEARLDDGRVVVTEAESMDVGVEVRILDDSGEASLLDAGTYTLEDGTKIVVNEDSRLASLGDDEVEVEVELEHTPDHKEDEEDEMGYDKKKVDMNYDKVRDALDQGFPDLGQDTIDAIATLVATIYSNDEEVVEVVAEEEEEEEREDMSKFLEEAFASISERLNALEDAPASKGVTHSPNNFSATHKSKDLNKLTSVERALHIINSNK